MWEYFAKKPDRRAARLARRAAEQERAENYFTLEDVCYTLQQHPAGCVFELNAPHTILARLNSRTRNGWFRNAIELKQCFTLSEIYCPHEGIDRRAEYGVDINY